MERWLFHRTENWIVLLVLTVVLVGAVLFGGRVKTVAEGGRRDGDWIGTTAIRVAGLPERVADVFDFFLGPPRTSVRAQRFEGRSGLVFPPGSRQDGGYLLLARYDGDRRTTLVELIDLARRESIHEWRQELDPTSTAVPYPIEDGSLLLQSSPGLVMLDGCSRIQWVLATPRFHHSIERDADGHFWVPYRVDPPLAPGAGPGFREDGMARISRDGRILSLVPLSRALIAGGHGHLLYAMDRPLNDPMHMNDIQPVLEDGAVWRRGDLFVSLRSRSVVLLYRPSSDEVVWIASGPWMHQHDVNVVGPHEISVFSNNAARLGHGRREVLGANEVYLYDLVSGAARSPWRDALRRHDVRTDGGGRATVLAGGDVFVEESYYGRALRVAADGTLRWTYVNRSDDGLLYILVWSRYLDADAGARLAAAVTALDC